MILIKYITSISVVLFFYYLDSVLELVDFSSILFQVTYLS